MKKLIYVVLALGIFGGCKSPEQAIEKVQESQFLITMERTACFGKCPVDETTLSSDGQLWYKGVQFSIVDGSYYSNTDKGDYFQELYDTYFSMDYQDEYDDPYISDMPSTIFSFYKDNVVVKKVIIRVDGPSELRELEGKIKAILKETSNWVDSTNPRMQHSKDR